MRKPKTKPSRTTRTSSKEIFKAGYREGYGRAGEYKWAGSPDSPNWNAIEAAWEDYNA